MSMFRMFAAILIVSLSATLLIAGHTKSAFAPPPPIPLTQTYKLQIGNSTFDIRYNTTAGMEVKAMYADSPTNTFAVVLDSSSTATSDNNNNNARFTVELPSQIIESKYKMDASGGCYFTSLNNTKVYVSCDKDGPYDIIVADYPNKSHQRQVDPINEIFAPESRTLTIDNYPKGTSITMITGTHVVPEFSSSIIVMVMAISVAGVIGFGMVSAKRNTMLK